MQASNAPSKIVLPWANSGTKNTIPVPSQIGTTPGAASFTDGFPPLTFTAPSAGGVPPFGADFNGIFNAITAIQRWQSGGGMFQYDATWNADNAGYPKGAFLLKGDASGFWVNTTDANTTDPDTGGAGWVDLGSILIAVTTAVLGDNSTKPASTAYVLGSFLGSAQQTWTDETASRALSTTYTNSTLRPIEIKVQALSTSATTNVQINVGASSAVSYVGANAVGAAMQVSAVVQPGETYEATTVGANLSKWWELR